MPAPPTAALAAAGLIGGFATGRYAKRRDLAGVVFAAAGAACAREWLRTSGAGTTGALLGLYVAAMGGSHPLARKLGPWPAVLSVTAVTAVTSYVVADRARRSA